MRRNSDRLLRLVDELLLVARLTEDGLPLQVATVDLAEVAREVIRACRPHAEHKDVKLRDHTDQPVPARGDTKRLVQALTHLVGNAVKFTAPGGEITVHARTGELAEVIVTDTGIGISAAELPYVFDRFFRGQAAESLAVQGPGLGLTIAKSIVEAHGGKVHLESRPGGGTTVRLRLPRR